jgi:DNA primase
MEAELNKIYSILESFLGESKSGFDGKNMQLQFPCPNCVEKYGKAEERKFNLEINLSKQLFHCWKCADEGDEMHGSILKLIKLYGNEQLLKEYKEAIHSLRESKLYKLNFSDDDFNIDTKSVEIEDLKLPSSFKYIRKDKPLPKDVAKYLNSRGIGWDIIERYSMGYTEYTKDSFMPSYRIYIPSYDKYGDLNYWTGRDYLNRDNVVKYYNPKVERKNVIFNEEKVQWDADITLVEGPFDHIVVPNSIPLLGKVLNKEFKLYWEIVKNAKGNVNIWLDDDAFDSIKAIYKELNHGDLYNKIRFIKTDLGKDPSEIYEKYGYKGIVECLRSTQKIEEVLLQ